MSFITSSNNCQSRHPEHENFIINTEIGDMYVYNVFKYRDVLGYCTGKDDVSSTLLTEGHWEEEDTKEAKKILEKGSHQNIFLDIGCHIGWFTIQAAKMGYDVRALDADGENIKLLGKTAKMYSLEDKIITEHIWINKDSPMLDEQRSIELCKIDIEGEEAAAVGILEPLLKANKVNNFMIEFSPVFNDSYSGLYQKLKDYGYIPYKDGQVWDGELNFAQANIFFKH